HAVDFTHAIALKVSPKNRALIAAAVAVTVMSVYLFMQVKATPAEAHQGTARPRAVTEPMPEVVPAATTETRLAPTPAAARPAPVVNAPSRSELGGRDVAESAADLDAERRPNLKLENLME